MASKGIMKTVKGVPLVVPADPISHQENETVKQVLEALDKWADWAKDTRRGILTPYQLLAVVLWMIQTEKSNSEDESLIVKGWAHALLRAIGNGIPALHPVTLLPLTRAEPPGNWVMSITHAQEFLDSMPIGFDCRKVLEHFQEEADSLAADAAVNLTYQQAVAQRKKRKKLPWTDGQLKAVAAQVDIDGVASVAKAIGITRQTLSTNLKRSTNRPGPTKTHDTYAQLLSV